VEIIVNKRNKILIMINRNLIFDIGMHTGRDTEFYLKKGFSVISVEANPQLVEIGREKFKSEITNGQLVIIDKAISDTNGSIDFFVFENKDDWGTINPDWNRSMDSNVKTIKVDTVSLKSLIEKYGTPYYLKIDIEGADILCLKSLLKMNERPEYISIELLTPNNLGKEVDSLDILCHLKALGYNKFSISDQSKNNSIKSPQPSLEGQYVNYSFDGATSGLFGKELKGPWLSIDKIATEYLYYFHKLKYFENTKTNLLIRRIKNIFYKKNRDIFNANGWFDVHAKFE
jgi:FkbM family methyltransferase